LILHTKYYESSVFSLHKQNNILETLEVSYLGTSMWITTTDDRLRFQGVDVLMPDQESQNGYVFAVLPHDTIAHTKKKQKSFHCIRFKVPLTTSVCDLLSILFLPPLYSLRQQQQQIKITNRVFHTMDEVLKPLFCSTMCFYTGRTIQYNTTNMKELFKNAGLTSEDIATHWNSTLTVLAPTREAFAQFNNEDYQRFLEPVWQRHATEFLLNHISTPAMTREELVAQATLSGSITMLNRMTFDHSVPTIYSIREKEQQT
jgi:hypothetical protein